MVKRLTEKPIDDDLCDGCPAKRGEIFTAQLRGSSYRGRLIGIADVFEVSHSPIIVGRLLIANVQIANAITNTAAAEQDNEVLTSVFENELSRCTGPTEIEEGLFCTPINTATDRFIEINYPPVD